MNISLGHYSFSKGALEGPLDLKSEATRAIQSIESIGAAAVKHVDRGNLSTRITFSIKRIHDSSEEALGFALRHPTELLELRGTLTMQGYTRVLNIAQALIETVDSSVMGVMTTTRYRIVGGLVHELSKERV